MLKNVEETVRKRKSVRSYEPVPLSPGDRERVEDLIREAEEGFCPFDGRVGIRLLEMKKGTGTEKLGTYGVIRGAKDFLCVTAEETETAMEAVGYRVEKLVLEATEMGLGTCWLAGTFNRERFTGALELREGEIFPIVCPIGYPLDKKTLVNSLFRRASGSDHRKPWEEIFFDGAFGVPLTEEAAGAYAFPLEMLRLAPSAANRQPWRVVRKDGAYHFFREGNMKAGYGYDLQRLDTGICACHFHLAAEERALKGSFVAVEETGIETPENVKYLFSWKEN